MTDSDTVSGAILDIGAVEAGPVILVNNTGDSASISTTLRKALADADSAQVPGQRILFDAGVFPATITLANPLATAAATPEGLFIDASDISGSGVTVSGGNASRVFNTAPESALAMHSLTIRDPLDGTDLLQLLSMIGTVNFDPATNPEVTAILSTFPGLSYRLEASDSLSGYQTIPGSHFVADGFTREMTIILGSGPRLRARGA